jgi:hypothetical protein
LPKLRTVVVGGHSVGDGQVVALGRVESLRGLVLDSTLVGDECVEALKNGLRDLVIYKSERRAIVELSKYLARKPVETPATLEPECFVGDVDHSYFDETPVVVHLHRSGVTDADLSWLANLKDIRDIYAMQTNVTGTFLADMKGVSSLERLHLDNTDVTDSALANLDRCRNLTWLTLRDTRLTDSAIPNLEKVTSLTRLYIARTAISSEGINKLRTALPHCDVR